VTRFAGDGADEGHPQPLEEAPERSGIECEAWWQLHEQGAELRPEMRNLLQKPRKEILGLAEPAFMRDRLRQLDREAEIRGHRCSPPLEG
jgi:hypothetical protein